MFSDFWVEQGGYITSVTIEVSTVNYLFKSYKSVPTACVSPYLNGPTYTMSPVFIRFRSTASISLKIGTSNATIDGAYWQVEGYVN